VKRLSVLTLVFAVALAFFILVPAFLNQPFPPNPFLKIADVLDLFTPLVLIPIYYLLLYYVSSEKPNLNHTILFLVFAALWVLGQGMHLSANSIGHWLPADNSNQAYQVTYFYDEVLSHYLWHLGVIALSAQLLYTSWKHPFDTSNARLIIEFLAAIIYGLTIFIIGIEGGTVPIMLPFSILAAAAGIILGWRKYQKMPLLTFFTIGYTLATLIFIGWRLYWGGYPQFSYLGWI
jgi:hypothetical protein